MITKYLTSIFNLRGRSRRAKKPLKIRIEEKHREMVEMSQAIRIANKEAAKAEKAPRQRPSIKYTKKGVIRKAIYDGSPVKVHITQEKDESKASEIAEVLDRLVAKRIDRKQAIDMLLQL